MTERYRSASTAGHPFPNKMDNDLLSPRKTMLVLVIVVGCFAVLWPKVFYPMLVGSANQHIKPSSIDKTTGCCDVISEIDVNTIKLMSELCGTIVKNDEDKPLTGKELVAKCRNEIFDTCGIDISAVLQEQIRLGQNVKQILDEVRSLNGSLCLKYNFGVAPWRLGVPHRITVKVPSSPNIRQERPHHLRSELIHPAFRERGRAIPHPQPQAVPPSRPPPRILEGRPGPVPGMRPTIGGAGHVVPPPKQGTSSMSVIMPIYTIGIVIFFTYTLMKIVFKKQPEGVGGGLYPPIEPDPHFRKEVFESDRCRLGDRLTRDSISSKLVVNAMSALLDEVDQEIEARRKAGEVATQDLANGTLSNGDALKPQEDDQPTVKVLGMEMTASCEGGKKWSRPDSPVMGSSPSPPPPVEPVTPPQEIYLEGALPAQSHLLVADSATEPQPHSGEDPAVVLAGKMTLSVISLDSSENGTDEVGNVLTEVPRSSIPLEQEPQVKEVQPTAEEKFDASKPNDILSAETLSPQIVEKIIDEAIDQIEKDTIVEAEITPESQLKNEVIGPIADDKSPEQSQSSGTVQELETQVEPTDEICKILSAMKVLQEAEPPVDPIVELKSEVDEVIRETVAVEELKKEAESLVEEDIVLDEELKQGATAPVEPLVQLKSDHSEEAVPVQETVIEPSVDSLIRLKNEIDEVIDKAIAVEEQQEETKSQVDPIVQFKNEIDEAIEEAVAVEVLEKEVDGLILEAVDTIQQYSAQGSPISAEIMQDLYEKTDKIRDDLVEIEEKSHKKDIAINDALPAKVAEDIMSTVDDWIKAESLDIQSEPISSQKSDEAIDSPTIAAVVKSKVEDTAGPEKNIQDDVAETPEPIQSTEIISDEDELGSDEEVVDEIEEVEYRSSEEEEEEEEVEEEEEEDESEEEIENIERNTNRTESSGLQRINGEGSEDLMEESKYTTVSGATAAENDISDEELTDDEEVEEDEVIEVEEEENPEIENRNNLNHVAGEFEPEL